MNWQCDMEYRGEDFTSAVTFGNPDILVGSGMIYRIEYSFIITIHMYNEIIFTKLH